jgi:hypothetical protein
MLVKASDAIEVASSPTVSINLGGLEWLPVPCTVRPSFEFNHAVARTLIRVNTYFTSGVY